MFLTLEAFKKFSRGVNSLFSRVKDLEENASTGGGSITLDDVPTNDSNNAVKSNGVYDALETKSDNGHTHTKSEITDFPTIGTAASLNVAATGNAASGEVVKGNDTRLTDARTPTTHDHDSRYYTESEIDIFFNNKDEVLASFSALGSTIVAQTVATNILTSTSTASMTDGRIYFNAIYLQSAKTLAGLKLVVTTAGVFTANNNNKVGLYKFESGTLNKVAESTNDGTFFTSTGLKELSFTTPYVASPGLYYTAILWNNNEGTTPSPTIPVLRAGASASGENITVDFTSGYKPYAFTSGTDLGASYTLTSLSTSGLRIWAGLYI